MSFQDRLSASMKAAGPGLPGEPLDWGRVMERSRMSRTTFIATLATATVALVAVAVASGILLTRDEAPGPLPPTETPTPLPEIAQCSAAGMGDSVSEQSQLPPAIVETRRMIIELAIACDFEGLSALTDRDKFAFTFAGARDPARFWQRLEKQNVDVMADLVTVLNLEPLRRNQLKDYSWPRANRSNPSAADWQAVVDSGLYSQRDVRSMRKYTLYVGWRVAISFQGDWLYFISGD